MALADFDRERVFVELGHSSLFYFLHKELGLSKGAAFLRSTAARLIQAYPEIVDPLRDGRLCLSSVGALAKVLTPENRAERIPQFFHRSKSEANELVAALVPDPAPPLRSVVTAARPDAEMRLVTERAVRPQNLLDANSPAESCGLWSQHESPPAEVPPPLRRPTIEPLTADLRRLHITVSKRLLDKLSQARDALSHAMPGASDDELLEAGLDLLLEKAAKRRGLVAKPRKTPPPSKDDAIPAHVRREVFERDGGRCQFPMPGGGVCGSTYRVQVGHIIARALGGPTTAANCRRECETHNQFQADRDFGKPFMDQFRRRKRR